MSATIDRPVLLAHRNRQGVLLGLDAGQLVTVGVAAGIVLLAAIGGGPLAALASLLVAVPLATAALVRVGGVPAPRMTRLWLMKRVRHGFRDGTVMLQRPEAPRVAGTLNLPGARASVQVWELDGFALIYDPLARTASFTVELEVPGFLMKDTAQRGDLSAQLAQVLAAFTQREGIKRVALQERTHSSTLRAARDHYAQVGAGVSGRVPDAVLRNYEEVMDQAEPFAVAHRNFITITLDLAASSRQIVALGRGKVGVQALAVLEVQTLVDALTSAGVDVRSVLGARELAALVRLVVDPASASEIQNRSGDTAGVALSGIGPTYLEEPRGKNGLVLTDSAAHTTMWIHEWPRSTTAVGFVEPIVFARHPVTSAAIDHIFTVVMTPVPVAKALKQVQKEKDAWRSNERLRARRERDDNAADNADWIALQNQEDELVAGDGKFTYCGYLTVSAPTEAELTESVAGMRNALARAGMEAQILYCQQAEALMVNALPTGAGMK